MREKLAEIKNSFTSKIAGADTPAAVDNLRVEYLGKKGAITAVLRGMGGLSSEEKPVIGQAANDVRSYIEGRISSRLAELKAKELEKNLEKEAIDVTMPGRRSAYGSLHPLNKVADEMKELL